MNTVNIRVLHPPARRGVETSGRIPMLMVKAYLTAKESKLKRMETKSFYQVLTGKKVAVSRQQLLGGEYRIQRLKTGCHLGLCLGLLGNCTKLFRSKYTGIHLAGTEDCVSEHAKKHSSIQENTVSHKNQ